MSALDPRAVALAYRFWQTPNTEDAPAVQALVARLEELDGDPRVLLDWHMHAGWRLLYPGDPLFTCECECPGCTEDLD